MLQFTTTLEPQRLVWRCMGFAETTTVDGLAKELESLHAHAMRSGTREVLADVRELEFATSACLKEIVTWLRRVLELDEAQRYRVRFRSNPDFGWQRRSLGALAVFARDVVTVEGEGSR